ncbi:MAG: DUF2062 domain-containing protein [Candidatus Babeliales bacterium]
MKYTITNYLKKYVYEERSPHKLALSFCIGSYIAFSPFLFFHTIMVFAGVWLFQLNFPITLTAAYGINNPWTAIPIYMIDYIFGYWILHKLLHIKVVTIFPEWMSYLNYFFEYKLGLPQPCIWSFLIGGNLLGIILSVLLYPLMKKIFSKLVTEIHGTI